MAALHLLAILTIALWWGEYFWRHTPSRVILRESQPGRGGPVTARLESPRDWRNAQTVIRWGIAARLALGDIACGSGVLLLVGLSAGSYARRIDTWLDARGSGQAIGWRARQLAAATLDANTKKQQGILR
jgi:hypothetical protein